jgi:hypothetical protein
MVKKIETLPQLKNLEFPGSRRVKTQMSSPSTQLAVEIVPNDWKSMLPFAARILASQGASPKFWPTLIVQSF